MEVLTIELSNEDIQKITQTANIDEISFEEIREFFLEEETIAKFKPDGVCQIDPRSGERILFNTSRARRPHDNDVVEHKLPEENRRCVICEGKTTGVVDVAELSEGFTFINKNLFPILYPFDTTHFGSKPAFDDWQTLPKDAPAHGYHFLQWTSSQHDKDWRNMPLEDRMVVMRRLGALEEFLLSKSGDYMLTNLKFGDKHEYSGFVGIIKNHGRLVGGSLEHSHQQISLSNIMPQSFYNNWRFSQDRGLFFSQFMLEENPAELTIKDYGEAVLLTPYFMRRPFDMMLIVKDTEKKYIHQLDESEVRAVSEGWHDAIRAIHKIMPQIGREVAYNVVTHNGPGAGLYFEFKPYTQETGGFEHLGLFVCQANPKNTVEVIQDTLATPTEVS